MRYQRKGIVKKMLDIVPTIIGKDLFTWWSLWMKDYLQLRLVYKLIPVKNPTTEDGIP
jgi:hypothetical protein